MDLIKRLLLASVWSAPLMLAVVIAAAVPATTQTSAPPAGFTGIWKGTLRVIPCLPTMREQTRCGAVNDITFTIIEDGSQISGHYTCAIGTAICRNGNDAKTGKITSGKVSEKNIRFSVLVPSDVSNCDYTGYSPEPGGMQGGYTCYQGGRLIEQGMFEVMRFGG
jgi:hypothetical protein